MDHDRLRDPDGRRPDRADLHDARLGTGPLHHRRFRCHRRRRLQRRSLEEDRAVAGRADQGQALHHLRRGGPGRRPDARGRPGEGEGRGRGRAGPVRCARRPDQARGRGDADLHLGDDRRPQGRHPDPRQPRQQHQDGFGPGRVLLRGHGPVLPAAVPYPRAHGHVHLCLQGLHRRLRRERRGRGQEPPRGPAPHHGQRAPGLREDLRQGHGPGPGQPRPAAQDLFLGPPGRPGLRGAQARGEADPRRAGVPPLRRREARLLQDHRQDRAAGSASSSPAGRRSRRTSPSSSTPSGWSSSKATA